MVLDLDKLCKYCGRKAGEHKAVTFNCPNHPSLALPNDRLWLSTRFEEHIDKTISINCNSDLIQLLRDCHTFIGSTDESQQGINLLTRIDDQLRNLTTS